jgi:hypothetical protein
VCSPNDLPEFDNFVSVPTTPVCCLDTSSDETGEDIVESGDSSSTEYSAAVSEQLSKSDCESVITLDCSESLANAFGCLGRAEQSVLQFYIRLCDTSRTSSFLGFADEVVLQDESVQPSGVILDDFPLWTFSDIDPVTEDGCQFGKRLDWDDAQWDRVLENSLSIVSSALLLLEDAVASVPSFHGFQDERVSTHSFRGFSDVITVDPPLSSDEQGDVTAVPIMSTNSMAVSSKVREFQESVDCTRTCLLEKQPERVVEFDMRLDDIKGRIQKLRSIIDRDRVSVSGGTETPTRSSVRTRSMGDVPSYSNVQAQVLEYHLAALSEPTIERESSGTDSEA